MDLYIAVQMDCFRPNNTKVVVSERDHLLGLSSSWLVFKATDDGGEARLLPIDIDTLERTP